MGSIALKSMTETDMLNWGADFRRISWWLQTENHALSSKFIERGSRDYKSSKIIGNRSWDWWMKELKNKENLKASERALTFSILLKKQLPQYQHYLTIKIKQFMFS